MIDNILLFTFFNYFIEYKKINKFVDIQLATLICIRLYVISVIFELEYRIINYIKLK